ncbi:MAG TPA: hypothetical protein VIY51_18325 [Xanthobacteraceae bacterium]
MGAVQNMIPQNSQMFSAVRALGGNVSNFKLADINPLKAYETVRQEITSGHIGDSLNLGSSKPLASVSFPKIENLGLGNKLKIDEGQFKRAWASGMASQIQQNNRRMEDMSAFARNPGAWHGMPPH